MGVRLQQALDASRAYDLEQLCIQEVPPPRSVFTQPSRKLKESGPLPREATSYWAVAEPHIPDEATWPGKSKTLRSGRAVRGLGRNE